MHLDGAHHPGIDAHLSERVLQGERVDDGGEHAHVIAGYAIHVYGRRGDPRKMLPPPTTTSDLHTSLGEGGDIAGETLTRSGSIPKDCGAGQASPLSFRRIRTAMGNGAHGITHFRVPALLFGRP